MFTVLPRAAIGTIQGTRATRVTKVTRGTPLAAHENSLFLLAGASP